MTGSTKVSKNPELERAALATLQGLQRENGYVSNQDVAKAATALECTPRRIRRMLQRGYVRAPRRPSWQAPEDLTTRLMRHKGSIALVHKEMCETGQNPGISVRTMQRYMASHYDQRLLAGARGGYQAMIASLPTLERDTPCRNDEWAIDHTLLPVWVLLSDGSVVKPWMTTVLDAATRMVMAVTISPFSPTTEESVETIALAAEGFTTEEGDFVGGQPQMLHSDRGGDLVTRAMTLGLIEAGTGRSFTEAYTPQQNGKIERWHRTLKAEALPLLPGYDRTDYWPNDPRRDAQPVLDPAGLLPIESLQHAVLKWLRTYNFDRSHRGLGGRTPFEAWRADETPIQRVDAQAIRASMTQQITRTVRRARVEWDKRFYQLPTTRVPEGVDPETGEVLGDTLWQELVEKKQVILRFLPTRVEFVEVYTAHGEYIGRAVWTKLLDASEAAKAVGVRRKAIRTMRTSLEDIAAADAASNQAHKDRATAAEPSEDDKTYGARAAGTTRSRKKAQSASTSTRKAAQHERERTQFELLNNTVVARTGTDDLDF